MIYLDAAATTKPRKEVVEAMSPYFTDKWFNPSSLYSAGAKIHNEIDSARKTAANYIGASDDEIFFTSGGSESNCWAIQGFINNCLKNRDKPMVITTNLEHKSILECVNNCSLIYPWLEVKYVSLNNYGIINQSHLEFLLKEANELGYRVLVSIQFVNNETGIIQEIKQLSELTHRYCGILHTDAVQAFSKQTINVDYYGIDLMSVSGHKFGCPKGIGFLYKKHGVKIEPLIYGSQMDNMRGGTENVPYIMGMKKAIELIQDNKNQYHFLIARQLLIDTLEREFNCTINKVAMIKYQSPHIISVTFSDNITGEALIYMLDSSNIYISAGSACNAHSNKPSHVLKAIGMSDDDAARTIRLSLSDDLNENQVKGFFNELDKAIKILSFNKEGI